MVPAPVLALVLLSTMALVVALVVVVALVAVSEAMTVVSGAAVDIVAQAPFADVTSSDVVPAGVAAAVVMMAGAVAVEAVALAVEATTAVLHS